MNLKKVTNIQWSGVDTKDAQDFCDAYIVNADYKGEPMNEEQLDEVNENLSYFYEDLLNSIF